MGRCMGIAGKGTDGDSVCHVLCRLSGGETACQTDPGDDGGGYHRNVEPEAGGSGYHWNIEPEAEGSVTCADPSMCGEKHRIPS